MARIPGIPDKHCKITPSCRKRPKDEAIEEVLDHIEESLREVWDVYEDDDDALIRAGVTVQKDYYAEE